MSDHHLIEPDYREPIQRACTECDGKGIITVQNLDQADEEEPCDHCDGTGIIEQSYEEYEEERRDEAAERRFEERRDDGY